jgi:hypothetical protein
LWTQIAIMTMVIMLVIAIYAGRSDVTHGAFYVILAIYHIIFMFLYYDLTESNGSDAAYYYTFGSMTVDNWPISTFFVLVLAAFFRDVLGATLLDEFFIFQIAGYIGVILIIKTLGDVAPKLSGWRRFILPAVAFSPGLHFWSVALGKDSLALMALGLICKGLASDNISRPLIVAGLFLIFMVRPHVGVVEGGCLVLATAILSNRTSVNMRVTAVIGGAFALVIGGAILLTFLGIQEGDSDQLTSYIDKLQNGNQLATSAIDTASLIFPLRMAAFLFLPLFFDATNLNGLVLSLDNALTVSLAIYCMFNLKPLWTAARDSYIVGFGVSALILLTALLAFTSSNIGLAARQKMMVVPFFPIIFCALGASAEAAAISNAGRSRASLR